MARSVDLLSSNLVRRSDATLVNSLANHPEVYPWVRGSIEGPIDLTEVVKNPANHALFSDLGGCLFTQHQQGLYEGHTIFLPEARGKPALELAQEAICWMFLQTDAVELLTRCPKGNLGAKALTRAVKGEYQFTNANGWCYGKEIVSADIYSLTIQRWMQTAPWLEDAGQWFHDRLEEEYASAGKLPELHEDDPVHDRYVGAAVGMILGGQVEKAVVFYNRWAVMAGYQPIKILTSNPLIIDIRDCLLCIRDGTFWVI